MTRAAAVLALPPSYVGCAAPPGVDHAAFALALVEDVSDLLADLEGVAAYVAVPAGAPAWTEAVEQVLWRGVELLELPTTTRAPTTGDPGQGVPTTTGASTPGDPGRGVPPTAGDPGRIVPPRTGQNRPGSPAVAGSPGVAAFAGVVAAVLRLLAERGATEGVVVASDAPDLPGLVLAKLLKALGDNPLAVSPAQAGLVALGARLPAPEWLETQGVGLDDDRPVSRLRAAAGEGVGVAPRWHRLRTPADLRRLDPRLEGWEATRRLLSRPR